MQMINNLVEVYEKKYNLKSICGVELTQSTDKPKIQNNGNGNNIPFCYIASIFYDNDNGIVQGQESIFDSIIQCVFGDNFDDEDEIGDIHA